MKKVFLSVLAIAMMSGAAVFANNGKKPSKKTKKAAKIECQKQVCCEKPNCCSSSCDKASCVPMPGCKAN